MCLIETLKDTAESQRVMNLLIYLLRSARLRAASKQIWRISLNKSVSQLRPRLNFERLLVYINRRGTIRGYICVF